MQKEQIGVCNKAFDVLVKDKSILRAENKPIFEGLEKAIGETITERIKKTDLSKKRCVLLTGKDDDLIRGVACYLYYHYRLEHEAFYYMDYLLERDFIKREGFKYRWTSKASKKDYTCEALKDGVLFVENLITDDTELLNTLAAKTRNIMAGSKAGMLIVSTKDARSFSEYFRSQFEVIDLVEPTTQKTPRGKKQHYANPGEFEQFLRNINERHSGKPLKMRVNVAMCEMDKGRKFLNKNGKPKYKNSYIKKRLSQLK